MTGALYAAAGSDPALLVEVAREFSPRIEVCGPREITLDLSGITFMDSTGLSAILVTEMHARMRGQRFSVVEGPPHVNELFRLTGVDNFLEIVSAPNGN